MSHSIPEAAKQLLCLAEMRKDAAQEVLDGVMKRGEKIDIEKAYELSDEFAMISMYAADARDFCRLADALQGDNRASVFQIWNELDTDPREAIFSQAPAAHEIIHFYAQEDDGT